MLLTSNGSEEIIDSVVPKRFRLADQPVKIEGMTWRNSFYLDGAVGVGKTHNAWGLFVWLVKRGCSSCDGEKTVVMPSFQVVNVPKLMASFQKMTIQDRRQAVDDLIDVNWLILDDLGAEYRSEYNEQFIYDIVDGRYVKELYTGFISNIPLGKGLPYDIRIISRIRGIVGNNGGTMVGEDRRLG